MEVIDDLCVHVAGPTAPDCLQNCTATAAVEYGVGCQQSRAKFYVWSDSNGKATVIFKEALGCFYCEQASRNSYYQSLLAPLSEQSYVFQLVHATNFPH